MDNWNIHNDMLSITRTSLMLNCSPATIKRWYKWVKISKRNTEEVGLPKFTTDKKGTWFFTYEQIGQLQNFRKNLKWGQMSEFNSKYYWSKKKGDSNG